MMLPRPLSRVGNAMPPPHTSLSSTRLDLGVVAASKSVPNFYHRFMVTLDARCQMVPQWAGKKVTKTNQRRR